MFGRCIVCGVGEADESRAERAAAARAELLQQGGNAFAVAGTGRLGERTVILMPPTGAMSRAEVANLVAWLSMVAGLSDADVLPILSAQGYVHDSSPWGRHS